MALETYANLSLTQLMQQLQTSASGLSEAEARHRLLRYGPNSWGSHSTSPWQVLLHQFKSSLIYLLIIASLLAFALGDHTDSFAIAVILFLNAALGFVQEYKSERIAEKLSRFLRHHSLVKRGGELIVIEQESLVPGDIVIIKAGDLVPADLRLIDASGLFIDESTLTGESLAVSKAPSLGRLGQVFTGTVVERGEGVGVVCATGEKTELGRLAHLSLSTVKVTQYEANLQKFSSFLIRITLFFLLIIFLLKILITGSTEHLSAYFIFIIALAVAVVPEAMPVITTVTLARGALQLAKKHVVVKKISSLEDLGNITILCTDKTGTLTENQMKVEGVATKDLERLGVLAYACREISHVHHREVLSAFDIAIAATLSLQQKQLAADFEVVEELPFDPEVRRRRVFLKEKSSGKGFLLCIGSAETILHLSHAPNQSEVKEQLQKEGEQGWRHLAYAVSELPSCTTVDLLKEESHVKMLGIYSFDDPLKATARSTIQLAEELGVAVKILSGDSLEVVRFVTKQVGLLTPGRKVYTGEEIEHLTPTQLRRLLPMAAAFARVTPEQKYAIIQLLKKDQVVGYQGDGINDAPSLKLADVGIAVDTATEVAKESADILLLKEDLHVIVNGIRSGRTIFANINKYIKHTMVGNFALFFALSCLFLLFAQLPLQGLQLLFATLITDIPLLAIATDTVQAEELQRPRSANMHVLILTSLLLGIVTTLFHLTFYALVRQQGPTAYVQTSLYLFIIVLQFTSIISVRTRTHFWRRPFPAPALLIALSCVALIGIAIPYVPAAAAVFSFIPLPLNSVGFILVGLLLYMLVIDVVKTTYYRLLPLSELSTA